MTENQPVKNSINGTRVHRYFPNNEFDQKSTNQT